MDIDKESILKKFDKVFKHYDRFIEIFNFNKMDEIRDIMGLEGHETILDIGGGTGKLAEYLSEYCQKVYVLDESKGMLSKVKKNEKVLPILGDALATDFEDKSIDVVVVADVVHHIGEQEELMEEIYRILRIKGKLIILDLDKRYIRIKLLRIFEMLLFGKLYFRTREEVIDLMGERFAITEVNNRGHYFIIRGEKDA